MGVSRSGYYKWLGRDPSRRDNKRERAEELVLKAHKNHPSHGYRWVCAFINQEYNEKYSPGFIYSVFKALELYSKTLHKVKYKPRKERDKYPNLIFTTWECVDKPRQVIVSDMTAFYVRYSYYEVTFYFDVYTKQIIAYRIGSRRGDRMQYIDGLKDVIEVLKNENIYEPVVLHTDQGSVYASVAYNELIKETNIKRSMSRAGKPTDNPVNESLNGWIKEELFIDFKLGESKDPIVLISNYVKFYNSKRPCWALNYDSPDNFYNKFMNNEIEKKDTFNNRILSEVPKFVQKKMSTSKNEIS